MTPSIEDARVALCLDAWDRRGPVYLWGRRDCSKVVSDALASVARAWPTLYDGKRRTAAGLRDYYLERGCGPIDTPGLLKPGCLVFLARPQQRVHHVRLHLVTVPPAGLEGGLQEVGPVSVEAGGGDSDNVTPRRSLMEGATVRVIASDRPGGGWWQALDPFEVMR
jgi:hypothetical protein